MGFYMSTNSFNACERNNYFFGKLMTVKDFENEQIYFNSKRQLCTHMLHGSGIVCGLRVFLINNQTISIDAGMAVDYRGREILVPENNVKKISVIDGFEDCCESNEIYLCLKYKEEFGETTFSVVGSGKNSDVSQEFNRIYEGYQLFFTDKVPQKQDVNLNYLMTDEVVIYDKDGVRLKLIIPKYVNPSKLMRISVVFEKNNVAAPVNYNFDIQGEFFKSIENQDKLNISFRETEVSTYKTISKDYYLNCDAVTEALAELHIDKDTFSLEIGGKKQELDEKISHPVNVTTKSLRDVLISQYYSLDLDNVLTQKRDQNIYLAKFHLVSNQSDYFIEAFESNPFNQYLLNTELLSMIDLLEPKLDSLYPNEADKNTFQKPEAEALVVKKEVTNDSITGIEEIALGFYPKAGKSYYSNEFVHGLGYGQIAAMAAIENPENMLTGEDHIFYFGDRSVFDDGELLTTSPKANVAVLVNPEKGTMKLGVKLLDKTEQTSIKVRWWAFRPSNNRVDEDVEVLLDDSIKVVISPPTAQVEPMGQFRFTAEIEGASSQEIRWFMAEEGSGTIDNNGLYTAPSKEGVYEVRAQSVKYERKSASAYIVVSTY